MKKESKSFKLNPVFYWVLAFIGFALIVVSGKMGPFIFYDEYDVVSLIILIGIGLLLMAPLIFYILRARKLKS